MWTIEDVEKGLCTLDQVGSAKPIAPSTEDQGDIDKAAILDSLLENSLTAKTQAEFNAWAKANPGVYHPMLAKHNLARSMKEAPVKQPVLNKLTAQDMQSLSTADLKLILLADKGITTKDQVLGALRNADDTSPTKKSDL